MELILWRHAEAEDGSPDHARKLTDKGLQQAALMASWLKPRLPKDVKILVSPTQRTQQTAQALGIAYETVKELATASDASDVLRAAGWPDEKRVVVVVGHQPTLGEIAALLMTGNAADCAIKKGAVWWLSNRGVQDGGLAELEVAMSPQFIKKSKA